MTVQRIIEGYSLKWPSCLPASFMINTKAQRGKVTCLSHTVTITAGVTQKKISTIPLPLLWILLAVTILFPFHLLDSVVVFKIHLLGVMSALKWTKPGVFRSRSDCMTRASISLWYLILVPSQRLQGLTLTKASRLLKRVFIFPTSFLLILLVRSRGLCSFSGVMYSNQL